MNLPTSAMVATTWQRDAERAFVCPYMPPVIFDFSNGEINVNTMAKGPVKHCQRKYREKLTATEMGAMQQ